MSSYHKTFYVERTDFSLRLARVAQNGGEGVIEEIGETSADSPAEVKAFVQDFSKIAAGGYVRARCAVYPRSRLLRNCSLKDVTPPSDADALERFVANECRVNASEYGLAALNADDGLAFERSRAQRDLFICGAPQKELKEAQEWLVDAGIYPRRMELGSVASIGLLLAFLRVQSIEEPVLVLEVGEDSSHVMILSGHRLDSVRPLPLGITSMIASVREELGLKDEGAARRLFYSDSFDFREMGPRLINRLLREVQSMIGFYEVQTGQSITRMLCGLLPAKLKWLNETFSSSLGMSPLELDFSVLMAQSHLSMADGDPPAKLESPLGLLGLMINPETDK